MEMLVVMIASTLPLAPLLLWASLEDVSVDLTHSVPAAGRQRDEGGGWPFPERRVEDLNWRLQRSDWVALPGPVAVSRVPRRMQADALEILNSLDGLNVFFADTEHDPGLDGH
jgi:hypothetical protein